MSLFSSFEILYISLRMITLNKILKTTLFLLSKLPQISYILVLLAEWGVPFEVLFELLFFSSKYLSYVLLSIFHKWKKKGLWPVFPQIGIVADFCIQDFPIPHTLSPIPYHLDISAGFPFCHV